MATTRIRTLNFLPDIFKTDTNAQFLQATLDQLVDEPKTMRVEGYVGEKFGFAIDSTNSYVKEFSKSRNNYQLTPGVIFNKKNSKEAQDFISYPGILDSLKLEGGITDDNNRLFSSQFYSWDSFADLDKQVNYHQYYWLPYGPDVVGVSADTVFSASSYKIFNYQNSYNVVANNSSEIISNPEITLLRGGTYTFEVNQTSQFWIQGEPGITGFSKSQPNVQTRNILGVENNGASLGFITFTVPMRDAQAEFELLGDNKVDLVTTLSFDEVNGKLLHDLPNGIDGIKTLNGRTLMFYNYDQALPQDRASGYISAFYDTTAFDQDTPTLANNFGNYHGGYFSDLFTHYYKIEYVGDPANPVIRLVENGLIPVHEKITASYGAQWIGRDFYLATDGIIKMLPYLSASKDTLYYQDSVTGSKVGKLNIVDSLKILDVETSILGKKTYTSPNGVVFTNGLKIIFDGDIHPAKYKNQEFYVEGVGTSIELVPVSELISVEVFTASEYVPYDTTNYDITQFDTTMYIPKKPDYITSARNARNKNAWARSNRWFHFDAIAASAKYNNNHEIVNKLATHANKAKRPIIEFYPNLKLFNSGVIGKGIVDFMDFRTTDAMSLVAGKQCHYPDVETYTTSSDTTITGVSSANITITDSDAVTNTFKCSTVDFRIGDKIVFLSGLIGGVQTITPYYIVGVTQDTNLNITTFSVSEKVNGTPVTLQTQTGTMSARFIPLNTTVVIRNERKPLTFSLGHFITDSENVLPPNTIITAVDVVKSVGTESVISPDTGSTLTVKFDQYTYTLTVSWNTESTVPTTNGLSYVTGRYNMENYGLFDGAKVVFAGDTNADIRNKIYVVRLSKIDNASKPVITLTVSPDGDVLPGNMIAVLRGVNYVARSFHYTEAKTWVEAQRKYLVNQPLLFDVFDENGISLGDDTYYPGSSFNGTKLFGYAAGTGLADSVLGVPLKYSSVNNIGDITFSVFINTDTFSYIENKISLTKNINLGFVHNCLTLTGYDRMLGWQPALDNSIQYQIFEFPFYAASPTSEFVCDIPADATMSKWPAIQVYLNNDIQPYNTYSYTVTPESTVVTFAVPDQSKDTKIQVLVLSTVVSKVAYYGTPLNLSNNPLNTQLQEVNSGDLRRHYHGIYSNLHAVTGEVFGRNNIHDLGNVVPYGTSIVQHSAPLIGAGTFLRKQNYALFDSLRFNSREYVDFKALLLDTVNSVEYPIFTTPADILDAALYKIALTKTSNESFFWSDMLPTKTAVVSNTYTFANTLGTSIFQLSKKYDFTSANYSGVLIYLTRITNKYTQFIQLIKDQDYVINTNAPSVTVTFDLKEGDVIQVKEYDQTYGSYVPNTPTKLGLYPASKPKVVQDTNYLQPTYFIVGHDGSYTKLFGEYDNINDRLIDYRDIALLEFEKRIFNNLKVANANPITENEIVPGHFRKTNFSVDEYNLIYLPAFLDWVGRNRVQYKNQVYSLTDEFTYNYSQCTNLLDNQPISQGYWRGIYLYFYDTTTPNLTPWEMLGLKDKPTWWENRYGPAPYTADNEVLWNDLANGVAWNNGNPTVIPSAVRPDLLSIIPVDSAGNLLSPYRNLVRNYNSSGWQRDWKVGDVGPAEFSYRRSSTWPFDLMRLAALMTPARFFNLGIDIDDYKYNAEFNQYLYKNRSHIRMQDMVLYGSGTAKHSYLNWIVDYEKQTGVDSTEVLTSLLHDTDVRLLYRLAGFSDKNLLKFFIEKNTPNSKNNSLLIPDESFSLLLYDNQPDDKIFYSSVIIQIVDNGYMVTGNSQAFSYFKMLKPKVNGNYEKIVNEALTVRISKDYYDEKIVVPYGTVFYSVQELAQFIAGYGKYLESQGMVFNYIRDGIEMNWTLMINEFLYWAQVGWDKGALINLNPASEYLEINRENFIVQPLTLSEQNYILNQNLFAISMTDLAIKRDGTKFSLSPLKAGDALSYGVFNMVSIEHAVVFDNVTMFKDVITNLVTGLRQNRIVMKGTKSAEWNGTMDVQGFILNQDNVKEWSKNIPYVAGSIVKYKNKYWTTTKKVLAAEQFDTTIWTQTDYSKIQKGLLPNPSTRSVESALYYDVNRANLEKDGDLLGFSLIGYRPREFMVNANLSDVTQVNVYKNFIRNKGTINATEVFKGAKLNQGVIDYSIHETWAIKTGDFGGVKNDNFVEIKINSALLNTDPAYVGLHLASPIPGVQQSVMTKELYNYEEQIIDPNILAVRDINYNSLALPTAGYVNYNDVKMSAYDFDHLANGVTQYKNKVALADLNVEDRVWVADHLGTWQVFSPVTAGRVVQVVNNLNDTAVVTFENKHNLSANQVIAIIGFDSAINGYYKITAIKDPYKIVVPMVLKAATILSGVGICLKFDSRRISTPAGLLDLPLLDTEFTNNKVWVDTGDDGSWAVFNKTINYANQQDNLVLPNTRLSFGSAVAYDKNLGYLISDPLAGVVYRYVYDMFTGKYIAAQTITQSASFGSKIAHASDIVVISQPDSTKLFVYRLSLTAGEYWLTTNGAPVDGRHEIVMPVGSTGPWGSTIELSGDGTWLFVSETANNKIHVYRWNSFDQKFTHSSVIDGATLGLTLGDDFGHSISANYDASVIIVGAPNFSLLNVPGVNDTPAWGKSFTFTRVVETVEIQYGARPYIPHEVALALLPTTVAGVVTSCSGTALTCADTTNYTVDTPVIFTTGTIFSGTNIQPNTVYYVNTVVDPTTFTITSTKGSGQPFTVSATLHTGSMEFTLQSTPVTVLADGKIVPDSLYAVVNGKLNVFSVVQQDINTGKETLIPTVIEGSILTVEMPNFVYAQSFDAGMTYPRQGTQFGMSVATNRNGHEILVGAPFELNSENTNNQNQEGAVFRFTHSGLRYGLIEGTKTCDVTIAGDKTILLNGYSVRIPAGSDADKAAAAINIANITNVKAASFITNGKKCLSIGLVDVSLANPNSKLSLVTLDAETLPMLGIELFTPTQVLHDLHLGDRTEFGHSLKFDQFGDSVVVGAPAASRRMATSFDSGTIFDNNTTTFVDVFKGAGVAYLFDYVPVNNESVKNPGYFVYAQPIYDTVQEYSSRPSFSTSLEFNDGYVIVGSPTESGGRVITYKNTMNGTKNWSVLRKTVPVVDVNKIKNVYLYDATSGDILENLDHFDPVNGKLLGVVRENIDFVSNTDVANYNSTTSYVAWNSDKEGTLWFDTSRVRFIDYHQSDIHYNGTYWGSVFPGSDVAVYSWVTSSVPPKQYAGPGVPYNVDLFTTENIVTASGGISLKYCFWVRNTNKVFDSAGKTLSDTIIENYIATPASTGIPYIIPVLPNVFGLVNCQYSIKSKNSVLHLGYATGTTNEETSHSAFSLIREDYVDDFLPGLPDARTSDLPHALYDKLLTSLSGVTPSIIRGTEVVEHLVPNPYLPVAVQYGINTRPSQSMFVDRLLALENYFSYANRILAQYPIAEHRHSNFLHRVGTFFDTTKYWEYVTWWKEGYDDTVKADQQVEKYSDLAKILATAGMVVTVLKNGANKKETYIYTTKNVWERIGLEFGTIRISSKLWDYSGNKTGFGENFFDTELYGSFPSEETRNIIRALNEEIYVDELAIHRNKSLILLFEFMESETISTRNYLYWLTKTSFVDVGHEVRQLQPIKVYQNDNQDFLSGYINEVKPYHVVIKEFLFKYTGQENFVGDVTDFDVPAKYNQLKEKYVTPTAAYNTISYDTDALLNSAVWNEQEYTHWRNNFGVSLTGVADHHITWLKSYVTTKSRYITVDNASGFPINGTVLINDEYIGYSSVDRANNRLVDLIRGVNNTTITTHIPGSKITIDLPAVLVLDGGRGYTAPPKVTAYIDTTLYPAPRKPAVLKAVMDLDSIIRIDVIDPGSGYVVLPEIVIDPAISVSFSTPDVNTYTNTLTLQSAILETGDLVQYTEQTHVRGLQNGQFYYVGVLDTDSVFVIALYRSVDDAIKNVNRVDFNSQGAGTLTISARASCVSVAAPVRENQIALRFDRTSYRSRLTDWKPGGFYGAFFAGLLKNSMEIASSAITLQNRVPPVNSMLVSAQGGAFELSAIRSAKTITWSSRTRNVVATVNTNNAVRLEPSTGGAPAEGKVYPTLGLEPGTLVKFSGTPIGNLTVGVNYYIREVLNGFDITLNDTNGSLVTLSEALMGPHSAPLYLYVGNEEDTTTVTLDYPGILTVTDSFVESNTLKVSLTKTGLGGTSEFYSGMPIIFTGAVFGNIIEHQQYYVVSVIDHQTFTITKNKNLVIVPILGISAADNAIISTNSAALSVNEPIIFNDLVINGNAVNNFGGIEPNKVYYVKAILSNGNKFTVSAVAAGPELTLSATDVVGTGKLTSQKDVVPLISASGEMTIRLNSPLSPGQITGQQFTLHKTSGQFVNLSALHTKLLSRPIDATTASGNTIVLNELAGGTGNIYVGMPVSVATNYAGMLTSATYYVSEISQITTKVTGALSSTNEFVCDSTAGFYVGMPIIFTGEALSNVSVNTEYYVLSVVDATHFTINEILGGVVFQPQNFSIGSMDLVGAKFIRVSDTVGGPTRVLTDEITTGYLVQKPTTSQVFNVSYILGGYRLGIVNPGIGYAVDNVLTVPGTSLGGVSPENDLTITVDRVGITTAGFSTDISGKIQCTSTFGMNVGEQVLFTNMIINGSPQVSFGGLLANIPYYISTIDSSTEFTVSATPGGAIVTLTAASGFFTITDNNGSIRSAITAGKPAAPAEKFYLKVINPTDCEVYYDQGMHLPVPLTKFPYSGIRSNTVTGTASTTLTVTDNSVFAVFDPVVFSGVIPSTLTIGQTYYIKTKTGADQLTISDTIGGTAITLGTFTGSFIISKSGDYALLPEPFYFDQSLVRLNNKMYQCLVSNNDNEFILGKWELIRSDDRRFNALDRIGAYYQPTVNMPGKDVEQLLSGVMYPNSVYMGNAFAPDEEITTDTILNSGDFSPTGINTKSILWNGTQYIAVADTPEYSAAITSTTTSTWNINELMYQPIGVTDIAFSGDTYVITSTNHTNPIIISNDGVTWVANGEFTPYGVTPYENFPFDTTAILILQNVRKLVNGIMTDVVEAVTNVSLNSVAYLNGTFVAVGDCIVTSTDAYAWYVTYPGLTNGLTFSLHGVSAINIPTFTGFIAVGERQRVVIPGDPFSVVNSSIILFSTDGKYWTESAGWFKDVVLRAVVDNGKFAYVFGDNGVRFASYMSAPSYSWDAIPDGAADIVDAVYAYNLAVNDVTATSSLTNYITVSDSRDYEVGDKVVFSGTVFGGIVSGTEYYVVRVPNDVSIVVSETPGGADFVPLDRTGLAHVTKRLMVTVGKAGAIETSVDGNNWVVRTSNTTENLNGISYTIRNVFNPFDETNTPYDTLTYDATSIFELVAVGDNDTILRSKNSIVWTVASVFPKDEYVYTVQGDEFTAGYGPEELVPGVVQDNLSLVVRTRPGINWNATEFGHTGFNVVSVEYSPKVNQQMFDFSGKVSVPAQVSVFVIDQATNLSTRHYDYDVDWLHNIVSLHAPVQSGNKLRIDIYEIGNGNQLAKSNSVIDPIRTNTITGFSEIHLNCNYAAAIYEGSGVVRPETQQKFTVAFSTSAINNTIECESVKDFMLNQPISFSGQMFGGLIEQSVSTTTVYQTLANGHIKCLSTSSMAFGQRVTFTGEGFGTLVPTDSYFIATVVDQTTFTVSSTYGGAELLLTDDAGTLIASSGMMYFVKSISNTSNRITVSRTRVNGVAGEIELLETATGNMDVIINMSAGQEWTPPIVMHNGSKLHFGITNRVMETLAITNTLKTESTMGLYPGDMITFGETAFGTVVPFTKYFVKSVVNENEFTISSSINGPVFAMTDALGGVTFITSDYALDIVENAITAKIVFANAYSHTTDYLVYSVFGETFPVQYGYSLPETQTFYGNGLSTTFHLSNYVDADNMHSAVVEKNGERLTAALYSIDMYTNTITFTAAPAVTDRIGVTTFNMTEQQYLHTEYNKTGVLVSEIAQVDNNIAAPLAKATVSDMTGDVLTCNSTTGFVLGQIIIFKGFTGTGVGSITYGTVYYVRSIMSGTTFKISATPGGAPLTLTSWTGLIMAEVGERPTTRVITKLPHGLVDDDLVRIDNVVGSYQLNNNLYYVKKINDITVDIYFTKYAPLISSDNQPVTLISKYVSGGFMSLDKTFVLHCAEVTSVIADNQLVCDSTMNLVVDTPIYFSGTAFGNLLTDTQYFVKEIVDDTHFTISGTYQGPVAALNIAGPGHLFVSQWSQTDVDRLWVTINGKRVPSSAMRLNPYNNLTINSAIAATDEVIITNMIPTATPHEVTYIETIKKTGTHIVNRANANTRTWLREELLMTDKKIMVHDISKITRTIVQQVKAPTPFENKMSIGLTVDKRLLCQFTVYNNTKGIMLNPARLKVVIEDLSPILKIIVNSDVDVGDDLTITSIEGNVVYINGEQIRFTKVDMNENSLSGLIRGTNGTGRVDNIPVYTEVFGLLSENILPEIHLGQNWSTGPLQLGNTVPGQLLIAGGNYA